jgi:hypothetical protein
MNCHTAMLRSGLLACGLAAGAGCLQLEKRPAEDHLLKAFPVNARRASDAWITGFHIFFCRAEGLQAGQNYGFIVIEPTAHIPTDLIPRRQCVFELRGFANIGAKPVVIDGTMLALSREPQVIQLDFIHASPVVGGELFLESEGK